jgi:transcriptional regulator with XRE-family HTH domain
LSIYIPHIGVCINPRECFIKNIGRVIVDSNDIQRQIGLRFRELRLAKGLRQEDLEKWDFSYRYYGTIERGITNPTLGTLIKLCEIFEISLMELFSFMDSEGLVTDEREAVAVKIAKVLKENKKTTIQKLKVFLDEILTP